MVTREDVQLLIERTAGELKEVHDKANREYTESVDALDNFKRRASEGGMTMYQVWYVLTAKHWDGIKSYIRGFVSQREDVRGRIKDLILYLILLLAMIEDADKKPACPQYYRDVFNTCIKAPDHDGPCIFKRGRDEDYKPAGSHLSGTYPVYPASPLQPTGLW